MVDRGGVGTVQSQSLGGPNANCRTAGARRIKSASYLDSRVGYNSMVVSTTWGIGTRTGTSGSGPLRRVQSTTKSSGSSSIVKSEAIDRDVVSGDADRYSTLSEQTVASDTTTITTPVSVGAVGADARGGVQGAGATDGTLMASLDTRDDRDAPSIWLQYHLGHIPPSAYRGSMGRSSVTSVSSRYGTSGTQNKKYNHRVAPNTTSGLLRSHSSLDIRQKNPGSRRGNTYNARDSGSVIKFDDLWWVSRNSTQKTTGLGQSSQPVRIQNGGPNNLGLSLHGVTPSAAPTLQQRPNSSTASRSRSANQRLLGTNRSKYATASQYYTLNGPLKKQEKYSPDGLSSDLPNLGQVTNGMSQTPKAGLITLDTYPGYRNPKPGSANRRQGNDPNADDADEDAVFNSYSNMLNGVQYVVNDQGRIVKLGDVRLKDPETEPEQEEQQQHSLESCDHPVSGSSSSEHHMDPTSPRHDPQTVVSVDNVQDLYDPGETAHKPDSGQTMDTAIAAVNLSSLSPRDHTTVIVNQEQSVLKQSSVGTYVPDQTSADENQRMSSLTKSEYFSMEVADQDPQIHGSIDLCKRDNMDNGSMQESREDSGLDPERPTSRKNKRSVRFSVTNQVHEFEPGEPIDSDSVGEEADDP